MARREAKEIEAEKSRTVLKFFLVLSKFAFDIDDDDAILGARVGNGKWPKLLILHN